MAAKGKEMGSYSNLQSFLNSTTPTVQSLSIPKAYARDINGLWQPTNKDKVEFFYLANLWQQYDEWSAYGAGVPIRLRNGETLTQYYTPYLSAIQIYTTKNRAASSLICSKSALEASESDSWSDESEGEKSSGSWDAVTDVSVSDHDGTLPTREHLGYLYFQFDDNSCPYGRLPLLAKVQKFAKEYPGLVNFRSADISPASWMSVAWYPIYQIPPQRNVHEFSTCFLTYHTISSSFQDHISTDAVKSTTSKSGTDRPKYNQVYKYVSLPSFGLASHKMKESLWNNPQAGDAERFALLRSAADSWLKQLKFQHHDFNYFNTRTCTSDKYLRDRPRAQFCLRTFENMESWHSNQG